jgi:hypothetical protein
MTTYKTRLAFVVPTLCETAAQEEDIIQVLLYAAARLEYELRAHPDHPVDATIVTVEPDTGIRNISYRSVTPCVRRTTS